MLENIAGKIVDHQIEQEILQEADRNIYLYGYQMLMEFGINIITSVIIAVLFQAFDVVIVFTIAYLMMRGYAGGYHAKTSLGCFGMSAGILVIAILGIQKIAVMNADWSFFAVTEIIMMPVIFYGTPIPVRNKPISANERCHFKKRVKQIYVAELLFIFAFLGCDKIVCALSIIAAQAVIFAMAVIDVIKKNIEKMKP